MTGFDDVVTNLERSIITSWTESEEASKEQSWYKLGKKNVRRLQEVRLEICPSIFVSAAVFNSSRKLIEVFLFALDGYAKIESALLAKYGKSSVLTNNEVTGSLTVVKGTNRINIHDFCEKLSLSVQRKWRWEW